MPKDIIDRMVSKQTSVDEAINEAAKGHPVDRAEDAAEDASRWHQGSGTHADSCAAIAADHHDEYEKSGSQEHLAAAHAWADAAEAEAKHLRSTKGEWMDVDDWKQSGSGKAALKASAMSRKLGYDPSKYDLP